MKLGLLKRRECFVPTARGWIALALAGLGTSVFTVWFANPFLCINRPVSAQVLVVESWLPGFALAEAVDEFKRGRYQMVITTGGNLPDAGALTRYKTGAEFAAAKLAELG